MIFHKIIKDFKKMVERMQNKLQSWNFRGGRISENLARYILSKFSFVSEPISVGDDNFVDFSCTFFEIEKIGTSNFCIPKFPFLIQIKSNKKNIDITDRHDMLSDLQIPFYIGVINKKLLKITIYSGEGIPYFYLKNGIKIPKKTEIKLVDHYEDFSRNCFTEIDNKGKIILKFSKICEIDGNFDYFTQKGYFYEFIQRNHYTQFNISLKKTNHPEFNKIENINKSNVQSNNEYLSNNYHFFSPSGQLEKLTSSITTEPALHVFNRTLIETLHNLIFMMEQNQKLPLYTHNIRKVVTLISNPLNLYEKTSIHVFDDFIELFDKYDRFENS